MSDSVGGDPAREALSALVGQFSQRSAFVRELVQNSLDAGAGRVELQIEQRDRRLCIRVIDDGEGMDRRIIDEYLLTLFRSSKEEDLTKIGKFGIGFVSLFAVEPELVVVDTARDGTHHRIVFEADHSYTLALVDEPFEGTSVTLYVRTWGKKARVLAEELDTALRYWCRHAHAEIWTEGHGKGWSWGPEELVARFEVESPVHVSIDEPGFRAVLGPHPDRSAPVGWYNRGLTLLEACEDAVPGVTFRVEAKVLEHTLTRDNVRRDGGYRRVVRRLADLAEGPLTDAIVAALRAAVQKDDVARVEQILAACPHLKLPEDLPILRCVDASWVPMSEVSPPLFGLGREALWIAEQDTHLARAVADDEERPVLAAGQNAAVQRVCARWSGLTPRSVESAFIQPLLVPHPIEEALAELVHLQPYVTEAPRTALFQGGGAGLEGHLAILQRRPGALADKPSHAGTLVIDVAHPLFTRAAALPTDIGARVLLIAALRAVGNDEPVCSELLAGLS
ncbi:MAG: hypothetical protein GY913_09825 [Proteobacteria bacterium]|nr:hypothetical protein [Pseudomonadota bacterium]MCP4917210.1 hypothetical protein [Pseudomonadota bacterium]